MIQKFGLQPHQVVENFISERHVHFIDDVDVNPIAYAEQFIDPDPTKAQTPEELLRKARLILSTELGKDPLLRNRIRMVFRETAHVTVVPTERGIQKIEENHPYFASIPSHNNTMYLFSLQSFKYLLQKPIAHISKSAQFLHILAAEKEHLVTINMSIPSDAKAEFERKLIDAFSSDHFTDSAKAWNNERSLVIQEVMDQHLMPSGIKWVREMLKDAVEDYVAGVCGERLRSVSDL